MWHRQHMHTWTTDSVLSIRTRPVRLDSNSVGSFAQSRMAASRVLDWLTPRPTSLLEAALSPGLSFCCRFRRRRSARVSLGCSRSLPLSVDAGRQRPGNTAATRTVPCPFDHLRQQREVPSTLIREPVGRKTAAEILVDVSATLCRQAATPEARVRSGWNIEYSSAAASCRTAARCLSCGLPVPRRGHARCTHARAEAQVLGRVCCAMQCACGQHFTMHLI
eukprot:COSAG02_NODE_8233_length_2647_cov_169.286599_2_plen_221_part_00